MNKEAAGGIIFLFTGIYGLIFSIHLPMGKWKEPGPGIFPLCLSILLCISGILWFIHGKRKGKRKEKTRIDWHGIFKKLAIPSQIVVLTGAFVLTLDRLGYLVASSLYLFALFLWVSRYSLWVAMGLAVAMGVGSWYFFVKVLAIQLPGRFLPL